MVQERIGVVAAQSIELSSLLLDTFEKSEMGLVTIVFSCIVHKIYQISCNRQCIHVNNQVCVGQHAVMC